MAGQMIEFQSNGGTARGYLSTPESGKGPGVVVIQEWWGLVPHICDVADRFARAGFVALAPDLYHGDVARSPDEAGKLMMALNIEQTEKDLRGAVEYLSGHEATEGASVGTVGFCMGGVLSLYAASKNERVGACVVFYGIHPKVEPDFDSLRAPVLGLYAERDKSVPPDAVHALEENLKKHGKSAEMHIYPGTDHAFFNDTRPEVYDAEASADAWQRTIEFFRKHLTG
ncbi:MAG: carboxymethylenebutenolidase [Acidobacteriota bacterium]|jgi:carboxymethylenebutenolidase|nr:carboxymethylenebutenolidase [Acidobacteriota bacterium]MDT7779407.1 carboxymethylenebutenolidase [Acidobacteriota bacterium]